MQRVEYYIPFKLVDSGVDDRESEVHLADIITENDFMRGGGGRLMGPLTQIPGVTIDRTITPVVQTQVARFGEDPYAIVYHATPAAEKAVHNHFRLAGLVRTENMIRVLKGKHPNVELARK